MTQWLSETAVASSAINELTSCQPLSRWPLLGMSHIIILRFATGVLSGPGLSSGVLTKIYWRILFCFAITSTHFRNMLTARFCRAQLRLGEIPRDPGDCYQASVQLAERLSMYGYVVVVEVGVLHAMSSTTKTRMSHSWIRHDDMIIDPTLGQLHHEVPSMFVFDFGFFRGRSVQVNGVDLRYEAVVVHAV